MTKTWHKKTAVASMFQNGISRYIPDVSKGTVFAEKVTYYNVITLKCYKITLHSVYYLAFAQQSTL